MSVVPGQDAKDKGNAAFKSGDFPAAIGHYTAAILADPRNPTYPLNRAAAYLKLGKNEDAERDCDATIKLDQKNVKAWFRRGQARAAVDKLEGAKDDFKRTLQLDPANAAAKQELAKVEALLQYRAANIGKKRTPIDVTAPSSSKLPAPPTAAASPSSTGPAPRRRRVPIKIVDTSASGPSSPPPAPAQAKAIPQLEPPSNTASASTADDFMKPVSTRTLSPSTSSLPSPSPAPAPKATSFKELKQTREANKSTPASAPPATSAPPRDTPTPAPTPPRATAGGGIFRANGQHTVFDASTRGASAPRSQAQPAPTADGQGPMTLFAFNRAWAALDSPERRWGFLVDNVPPASLPAMFKTSLEAPHLVAMLETFRFVLADGDDAGKDRVKAYLLNFARVPRFSTIVMFMNRDEKALVKEVWDGVGRADDQIEVGVRKVWSVL
ncbi:RNA polymerase II-associated protein [Phanerochaete sordida]|uniref:RNA polymerase II-associated protein 3 n=1 Tax=Phanerochaete sordida TaxID=48140 RepID=A0A9P3LCF6_9APHY|nr:RNA polymerase II-associated protein [Phanerochaete sordida]